MLEITCDDIAALSDEDLRSLVGRLCEAELRSHGLSTSAVTWGGNQDARDGGIDVRVRIEDDEAPGGFVPRTHVGFQVKKTDFTPSLIRLEMCPLEQLRESIVGLIGAKGAYIIASSGSNVSDSALNNRLDAMRSAVAGNPKSEELRLDFYDRSKLATWTRSHPGLVAWVRQKVGREIPGWQPYNSWATSPEGVNDEFLLDDETRLHFGMADDTVTNVTEGIDRIRNKLRTPRKIVRLTGLSGVGKTRLVQALFDARVGQNPLAPDGVIYTDMSDNPSPQPTAMISDLIAARERAIVVVDNCAPELHRRITQLCQGSDSLISAITVEYDVKDDEPEGTEVVRLEPSSDELVVKLIARRFPEMSSPDVERIAVFSGGNARIALALANRLERGESVAGLHDEELFRRLFQQRQDPDDSLLKAAKACSLLYSFEGESLEGDEAELPTIAAIVGMDAVELFGKVAQLKHRDLVQCRSVWRAILPHAIANRLATMALQELPLAAIEQRLNTNRLIRSFSRRLGYLHESDDAKRIVETWVAKNGLLADVGRLNEIGFAMFENIAPVSPEATLAAIECALYDPQADGLINDQQQRDRIGSILRSIAYDASHFDRCVAAVILLVLAEEPDNRTRPTRDSVKNLFHIYLSGTHATIAQRAKVVEGLLCSSKPDERKLGLELLGALLEFDYFTPSHSFEFGARARDYGYAPKSRQEELRWFGKVLRLTQKFATKNDEVASTIRSMVAQSLWSLWFLGSEIQEQFESIGAAIAEVGYWQDGWIAVRYKLSRLGDEEKVDSAGVDRLRKFEVTLRPKNIAEQVWAVVLSNNRRVIDYADADDVGDSNALMAAYEKANVLAEELGKAVCIDPELFAALLPDLVSINGTRSRLFQFGKGLAIASVDRRATWDQLTCAVANTEESKRNGEVLCGFLNALATVDEPLCEALLEEALTDRTLGKWFPGLQSSVTITRAGVDRLKRAASLRIARADAFRFLGWERPADAVNAEDLRDIIDCLAMQEDGYLASVELLASRIHAYDKKKEELPPMLIEAGRQLIASIDFTVYYNSYDYDLRNIAEGCLRGDTASDAAKSLCERIRQGLSDHTFHAYDFEEVLKTIFAIQPQIALDAFFGRGNQDTAEGLEFADFGRLPGHCKHPIEAVPSKVLLEWCDAEASERYRAVALVVSFDTSNDASTKWTPLALEMLQRSPDPLPVLQTFVNRFRPKMWSGSRAAILESRLGLLDQLATLSNPSVNAYVMDVRPQLAKEIDETRKWENERESARDERFE